MKSKVNYYAILTFYIVAILFRYLTNKTGLLDDISSSFIKAVLQGAGPAIGAVIAFTAFNIKPKMNLKGNYSKFSISFLLYWGLPIALISTITYFTTEVNAIGTIFIILSYGLLEEIGWRGFLHQELKEFPKLISILAIAILWFIWHLNFDLTLSNFLFFVILILGSWGIGLVADKTNSLLAVAAFHSLNNFFPQLTLTISLILVLLIIIWITHLVLRGKKMKV